MEYCVTLQLAFFVHSIEKYIGDIHYELEDGKYSNNQCNILLI